MTSIAAGSGEVEGAGAPEISPERKKARGGPWVIYPILFGVYPILSSYALNVFQAQPKQLTGPIALAFSMALIFWALAWLLTRDAYRAGLITLLATVLFYTVIPAKGVVDDFVNELMTTVWVRRDVSFPVTWVNGVQVVMAVAAAAAVWRFRRDWTYWRLTRYLNAMALILVGLPTYSIVMARRQEPARPFHAAAPLITAKQNAPASTPDIYYIILDGFARADVLKELFAYDLEPFLKGLERRGFYVPRHSTANYCQTPLCLSSSFNGVYLDGLIKPGVQDTSQLGTLIGDGAVVRGVKSLGYEFVTFSTGFDQTEFPTADAYLSPFSPFNGFHRMLLGDTPLVYLLPNRQERDPYTMARSRPLFLFDSLPEVARRPGPKFTFAHVLGPHPPFVFGPDGEDVSPRKVNYFLSDGEIFQFAYGNLDYYTAGYRDEVAYLTKRVERAVDAILARSAKPPVIVIQSDHGSGSRLHTEDRAATDIHERMSILNAYYLPGHTGAEGAARVGLYDTVSPVNSFRVIFNTYFDAGLPLIPDRSYYSTWSAPFAFIDVTDEVRATQDRGLGRPAPPAPEAIAPVSAPGPRAEIDSTKK